MRFLDPEQERIHAEAPVTEVVEVALDWAASQTAQPLTPGALALVAWTSDLNEQNSTALHHLMHHLKQCRVSALALQSPGHAAAVPPRIRSLSHRLKLPLLVTNAVAEWVGINNYLQQQRAQLAERQVAQLDELINRLPSQVANPRAVSGIVSWLSAALSAHVVVSSDEQGIVAAAPSSSPNIARALVTADDEAGAHAAPAAPHTRLVQILGAEDGALLAVASYQPFDSTAGKLIRHAAKLLGLCEQARLDHQAAVLAPRSASQAATQLLLVGDVVLGQIVATTIVPSLMDTEDTRVRIIDTGHQDREPTLQWCERRFHGRALVSPCPGKDRQIIVVTPTHTDDDVQTDLHQLISSHSGLFLGESTSYPLKASGAGYAEAAQAVRAAARSPERISVGTEPKFAPLLPRDPARAWAQGLLAPLLGVPEHRPLLDTLPRGLAFKAAEASKALGIHRNTLRQRLTRAETLLGLNLDSISDRVLVLLALDILALPAPAEGVAASQLLTFAELVASAGDSVKEWAAQRLRPLESDRRGLLTTVCAWLENDLSVKDAARALNVSEATVRDHTKDASYLLGIDANTTTASVHNTDIVTVADVGIAAYLLTGRPRLDQPRVGQALPLP